MGWQLGATVVALAFLLTAVFLVWVGGRRKRAFAQWLEANRIEGLPVWLERIRFIRRDRPWEGAGFLSVDDPGGRRFGVALELLAEGRSIVYRGIRLSLRGRRRLVAATAADQSADRVTEDGARRLILGVENELAELMHRSPAFQALVKGRRFDIEVIDYPDWERWTLSTLICEMRDGKMRWARGAGEEP